MFEWNDEQQMIRDAVRRFVDDEVRPHSMNSTTAT